MQKPTAILSTTILPLDGLYAVVRETETTPFVIGGGVSPLSMMAAPMQGINGGNHDVQIQFAGIPHYIGHPDTKALVEALGALSAPTKLFAGLQVGEAALAVAIKQGRSTRATTGSTEPHQEVTWADLEIRVILRIA